MASRRTAGSVRHVGSGLRKIQGKKRTGAGRDYYDYNLLAAVILLTCFGLVMLYSTSAYEAAMNYEGNDAYYFFRQAAISGASLIMLLIFLSLTIIFTPDFPTISI